MRQPDRPIATIRCGSSGEYGAAKNFLRRGARNKKKVHGVITRTWSRRILDRFVLLDRSSCHSGFSRPVNLTPGGRGEPWPESARRSPARCLPLRTFLRRRSECRSRERICHLQQSASPRSELAAPSGIRVSDLRMGIACQFLGRKSQPALIGWVLNSLTGLSPGSAEHALDTRRILVSNENCGFGAAGGQMILPAPQQLAPAVYQGDPTANWFIALTVTEDDLITVIGLLPVSALISVKPSVGTRMVSDVA